MKKVGLLDRNFAQSIEQDGFDSLSKVPTKTFVWERNIESFLKDTKIDTIVFTDECIEHVSKFKQVNKKKIAWLLEPVAMSRYYNLAAVLHKSFDKIVSSDLEFAKMMPNGVFAPFAGTWIDENDWSNYDKTKLVSMISSNKRMTEGHELRFKSAELINDGDVYGTIKGERIVKKLDGLKDYMFSVVIENCRRHGYFTEKIVDCFLTATIPIYWGCPNIDYFFDPDGIIKFETVEELKGILANPLFLHSFYESRANIVQKNARIAADFSSPDEIFMKSMSEARDL